MDERSTTTRGAQPSGSVGGATRAAAPAELRASAPASADARLAPAFEALADPTVEAVSVDVFDTLLWRKVPEPVDAFLLLGARLAAERALADDVAPAVFARLRETAEERARAASTARGGGVEVGLRDVYAQLPPRIFRGALGADELVDRELELECSLVVADLDVVELLRAARTRGKRIFALSDTYFSAPQLRRLLARPELSDVDIDDVFTSSDHGVGKGEGLFTQVLSKLGHEPAALLHVGDNHQSDVAIPSRLGVRAVYFERRPAGLERVLEREQELAPSKLHSEQGDFGLSAMRSKLLHRADAAATPPELRQFWEYGAAHLGPVFTGFSEWVHERAQAAGVSKVFCLMREGELLAQLINAAGPQMGSSVTAEPIWLSRLVCARASIVEGTQEELRALFDRRQWPTLREFCATLGIDPSDLPALAHRADARMTDGGLGDAVLDAIAFDAGLRARVVASSRELRQRVVRYVQRMLPPGERRLMLVDLGWAARTQRLMQRLLFAAAVECEVSGLYLVTREATLDHLLEGMEVHGFLAHAGLPEAAVRTIMRSPEVLEQVCMPDFGSQIGMTAELQPVLAEIDLPALQSEQRHAVQEGIHAFQREWRRYRGAARDAVPALTCAEEPLRATLLRAVAAPTLDEAATFGRWMHDENFGSEGIESIVARPAAKSLSYLDPRALVEIPMTELYWPFGLAALHDEHLASATAAATTGVVPFEAFSSAVELGDFEFFADYGWGFRDRHKVSLEQRRNRMGLSFAKATLHGEFIRRVRLDPAKRPCVLRIDWIRVRCHVHDASEPVTMTLERPGDFGKLKLGGAHRIGPKLLLARGEDPRMVLDIRRLVAGRVYAVDVECGYAALPLSRELVDDGGGLWRRLRELAKRSILGAPVRLAVGLARRLR